MPLAPIRLGGALLVLDTDRRSVVAEKVELGQISVQVLFFAVLIGAAHTALEHGEVVFDGVRVNFLTAWLVAGALGLAVVPATVAGEVAEPILVKLR